ncbi:hypothetical protein BMS3Abin03_01110 [bacterium BMS3Abin03]|nr:hypothetical protein BMS3Abin03_01110 [bacterium BMS3Abin03]
MNSVKIIFVVIQLAGLCCWSSAYAQSKNPDEILDRVKETFSGVEDYRVNVHIKVDVDFLKVPESDATVYFKQPDKIYVESEKFALLPKRSLNLLSLSILNGKHTALYVAEDTIRNVITSVVKVIPLGSESDIVLSTLWIDTRRNIIMKIESTAKPSGTFTIDFFYNNTYSGYNLPDSLIFTFTIDRMRFPKGMNGTFDSDEKDNEKEPGRTTGKVYLSYSDYRINQGLPDSIFKQK